MSKKKSLNYSVLGVLLFGMLSLAVTVVAKDKENEGHPELTEQEMLVGCAECHKEATPEVEKEWYDSEHGIAMIKCYQCHGTYETFKVSPTKADCAVCHKDKTDKCENGKEFWECYVPHLFKKMK